MAYVMNNNGRTEFCTICQVSIIIGVREQHEIQSAARHGLPAPERMDEAKQKIFMKRTARLCVIGMQSDRYHTDMDYRDALNGVWEMIPEPMKLILEG
jgi:hypothetical protein